MQHDHELKDLGELDEPPMPTEVLVSRIYSARRLRRHLAHVPLVVSDGDAEEDTAECLALAWLVFCRRDTMRHCCALSRGVRVLIGFG